MRGGFLTAGHQGGPALISLLLLFVYCSGVIFRVTVPFSELMSPCCPARGHLACSIAGQLPGELPQHGLLGPGLHSGLLPWGSCLPLISHTVKLAPFSTSSYTGHRQVFAPAEESQTFLQLTALCQDHTLVGMKLLEKISSVPHGELSCSELLATFLNVLGPSRSLRSLPFGSLFLVWIPPPPLLFISS